MSTDVQRGALDALERVLNRGGDADDVLRAVVDLLHERVSAYGWVGIYLAEAGELALGPEQGASAGGERRVSIDYDGRRVGELAVAPPFDDSDRPFLERVATLISPYCLVGWDTGGVRWDP